MPKITYLECYRCGAHVSTETTQTVCPVCPEPPAGSLFVRYDLAPMPRETVDSSAIGMWRYQAVLPEAEPVTLREGWMSMVPSRRTPNVLVKEGFLKATDRVVLFNTGTGLKYTDVIAEAFGLKRPA
jgi:threonine synthase